MNSATVAPKNDIDEISLEVIPAGDDRGVQTFMTEDLQRKLLLKQFNLSIRRVGMFLYIGTLAMAQKSEHLIKIQNALLENLKLNDTSAVMLQSFQSGAVNIVEKLKVAYLYLMDGFPEFAKTDVEAIGKDIETMRGQANKTKGSTKKCAEDVEKMQKLVSEALDKVKGEKKVIEEKMAKKTVTPSYQNDDVPRNRSGTPTRSNFLRRLCCECFQGPGDDESQVVTSQPETHQPASRPYSEEEAKEKLQKLEDDGEVFTLTQTVLSKASAILRECDGFLDQLLAVVEQWYKENKEVVAPSMAENIRRTEGMSEEEMKDYWQSVMFRQEVQKFYTRWVALKVYCEGTRKNLKEIRAETEGWYVDNPRPRDAVKKSWEVASKAEDTDIDRIIKDRDRRIEKQHRPDTDTGARSITY